MWLKTFKNTNQSKGLIIYSKGLKQWFVISEVLLQAAIK